MSTTSPSTSDRRNAIGNVAVVASVLLSALVVSFIVLSSYFADAKATARLNCLRPFSYEVDRQFGQAMLAAMNKDDAAFRSATATYQVAIAARDTANQAC